MNIKTKYYTTAEIAYLKRAVRLLEIILEEYAFKHFDKDTNRFHIPRGRFETEGIYSDDIDFCLDKYVNKEKSNNKPIIKLDNNSVMKNNFKFVIGEGFARDPHGQEIFEHNKWKYTHVFEFTLYTGYTYKDLVKAYNDLLALLEKKKLIVFRDISNFLYFEDRILNIKTVSLPVPIQIDFSKKKRRSPENMYQFVFSFIKLVKIHGQLKNNDFVAHITKEALIKQIQKDFDVIFNTTNISDAKSNFLHTKLPQRLVNVFTISDYQKASEGYNFSLILD